MKKIAVITSTRADWGLLQPLVKELDSRGHRPLIIATYAHLFPEMGDTIQELVDDGFPPAMSVPTRRAPSEAVADAVTGFTKAFRFLKPDIIVILGDRLEMMGVATAATLAGIPIAHIAGGAVSEGSFDDAFRNAITQMSTLHFPETEKGRRRLIMMGTDPAHTVTAGALGVFNALHTPFVSREELDAYLHFELGPSFILATFHPETRPQSPGAGVPEGPSVHGAGQSQVNPGASLPEGPFVHGAGQSPSIAALEEALARNPDLRLLITFPNTDTDATPFISRLYTLQTAMPERVRVVPSLGRVRYLSAARLAAAVVGNSSSGIVEVPSLGTPVVDVGVRQKGRQCSKAVIHCPLRAEAVADAISWAITPDAHLIASSTPNPYFREGTPSVIADHLLKFLNDSTTQRL